MTEIERTDAELADAGHTEAGRAEVGLIDMIQTTAEDMAESVRFYRDVLGGAVQSESESWSQLRLGGVDIGIHQRPAAVEGWMPLFRVTDIAATRAAVVAAGRPLLRDFHDIPGGVTLTFADPAGNPVSAVQYGASEAQLRDG